MLVCDICGAETNKADFDFEVNKEGWVVCSHYYRRPGEYKDKYIKGDICPACVEAIKELVDQQKGRA